MAGRGGGRGGRGGRGGGGFRGGRGGGFKSPGRGRGRGGGRGGMRGGKKVIIEPHRHEGQSLVQGVTPSVVSTHPPHSLIQECSLPVVRRTL